MKKINPILNFVLAGCLVLGAFAALPTDTAQASASLMDNRGISPEAFLNEDGSLNLDGSFNGSLDLEGWDVSLDSALGPVFSPLATEGDWSEISSSASPINGPVYSILVNGSDVYVGGEFEDAAGIDEADNIARWDTLTGNWYALGSNGAGDGSLSTSVQAMVMVGSTLYVGGYFGVNNDGASLTAANYLAKWDGNDWSSVDGGVTSALNDWVNALAVYGTTPNTYLYVGGRFSNAAGIPEADNIVRINLDTAIWSALGGSNTSDGSLNNNVYALAVDSAGSVYAGGFFTDVKDGANTLLEADRIAKWDALSGNWSALGNNGAGVGAINSIVGDILVDANDNVYASGSFTNAAGVATADYVAKWDGNFWSGLGSNGSGNGALVSYFANGTVVQHMILAGTDLYLGGYLTVSALGAADYLAKFDTNTNTWSAVGDNGSGDGSLNDTVYALAYSSGKLYIGGDFYKLNNSGAILDNANKFAKYSTGSGWSGFSGSSANVTYDINAIAVDGTDVYVGGNFTNLNGEVSIDYAAKWDGSQWSSLGNNSFRYGSLNNPVYAIAIHGDDIYAGGAFTNVNNSGSYINTADRIARWNKVSGLWSALGSNGSGDGAISNGYVYDIAVNGSDVYTGGSFTDSAALTAADYIARWDALTGNWSALSSNGSSGGSLNSGVYALAIGSGGEVYVGGLFTDVNHNGSVLTAADYIAKWDALTGDWSALGNPSPLSGNVLALAISGSDLYVGGNFYNANGIPEADHIAKYTPGTGSWASIGGNSPSFSALTGTVNAIFVDGSDVYVGGGFMNVYNDGSSILEADYIAKWDGSTWSALGNNGSGNGSLNSTIYAIAKSGSDLIVGGNFKNVNNNGTVLKSADYLAAYGLPDLNASTETFHSTGADDGWVLESAETGNTGGTLNKAAVTLRLGDDVANKQYRAILSFDTSALPDTAIITSATLTFKYAGKTGTNPFNTHGNLLADVCTGAFKGNNALQLGDFKAKCTVTEYKAKLLTYANAPVNGWYSQSFNPADFPFINDEGMTQFRLRFSTDDNNDFGADLLKIYSGNADLANQPQLIIEYYVP